MGIEIPPPKGGPAVFTNSSPGNESPDALSPDEESLRTPELGDDLNDGESVCLSEGETVNTDSYTNPHLSINSVSIHCLFVCLFYLDGTIDSQHRDEEDGTDVSNAASMANNVVLTPPLMLRSH